MKSIFILYAPIIAAQSFAESSKSGQFLKRTEYNYYPAIEVFPEKFPYEAE
jgi:hypothetical protein